MYRFTKVGGSSWSFNDKWDAVKLIVKVNLMLHGFGCWKNSNGKDMTCEVQWEIDGTDSEIYEYKLPNADMCPDKKMMDLYFSGFSTPMPAIELREGQ